MNRNIAIGDDISINKEMIKKSKHQQDKLYEFHRAGEDSTQNRALWDVKILTRMNRAVAI